MGLGDWRQCKICGKHTWIMWGYICKECLSIQERDKEKKEREEMKKKQIIHEPTVSIHIRMKLSLMNEIEKWSNNRTKLIVYSVKKYLEHLNRRENNQKVTENKDVGDIK